MKKFAITITTIFAAITFGTAQKSFSSSDKLVSLGIGIGSPYFGSHYSSTLPVNPTIIVEKGITDQISVGTSISYSGSKFEAYDLRFNAIFLGARAAYHFTPDNAKIDTYGGAGLGYVVVWASDKSGNYYGGASSGLGYTAFAGGRYYFTRATAIYAEVGYSSFSFLNAGLTFKF